MNNRSIATTLKFLASAAMAQLPSGLLVIVSGISVAIAQDLAPSAILLDANCEGLVWSEPAADTVSINIHDNQGAYITSVAADDRQYRPSRAGLYFIVETNTGPWQSWLGSQRVYYSPESNNGQSCGEPDQPLTVYGENGFLVWEPDDFIAQASPYRATVNIHTADGSYITTVLATDGRWPATQSGGYFFVAVVGENNNTFDWRSWRKSAIVQVDAGNDENEITTDNYQALLGSTLARWRAEHHAPFRNALTMALQQWFPILPDVSNDNGFDWQGLSKGERVATCESGSVTADVVDVTHSVNVGRLQIDLDFNQCVMSAIAHHGQTTVFLERSDNGLETKFREYLHWRDFEIASSEQFVQRLTGSEQLETIQSEEEQAFGRTRHSASYSEWTNGELDFEHTAAHFTRFSAELFSIGDDSEIFSTGITFREGGTMETRKDGRRQTLNANFVLRPDRDVGFHYATNPLYLDGVPYDQIEITESLAHVGLTILNTDSGETLQLRPGTGDAVTYTISSQNGATVIEDDFRYPLACDSRGVFTILDLCPGAF